jgi:hypothetical protein
MILKKKFVATILLTGILASASLSARAQEISGGIKGGLTMSNLYIDVDGLDDENARFGFHAGLFSQIMFSETFGMQPEMLYITKGTKATYEGLISQTIDFNLNYIDLPVFLVLRPVEILEIHVGAYVGLLLNSNVKYSGTIEGYDEISRDNFNTVDYGVGAGLALNFGNMQTGIRYSLGLQELADSDVANLLLGDSKNSFGQLYIAFRISQ